MPPVPLTLDELDGADWVEEIDKAALAQIRFLLQLKEDELGGQKDSGTSSGVPEGDGLLDDSSGIFLSWECRLGSGRTFLRRLVAREPFFVVCLRCQAFPKASLDYIPCSSLFPTTQQHHRPDT